MTNSPIVSILVPWCQRKEITISLARNHSVLAGLSKETIVINCGGDSALLNSLIKASGVSNVRQIDMRAPSFNKGLALNIGLHYSRADYIWILDADVILTTDILTVAKYNADNSCYVTVEWVDEVGTGGPTRHPTATSCTLSDIVVSTAIDLEWCGGEHVSQRIGRRSIITGSRAGPGLLFSKKSHLLAVKGYNSAIDSWGWEDDDIQIRLQYVGRLRRVELGRAIHLTHGDDKRLLNGKSRDQSNADNRNKCIARYRAGDCYGTYEADCAQWATSCEVNEW